jgi:hypothetical protein
VQVHARLVRLERDRLRRGAHAAMLASSDAGETHIATALRLLLSRPSPGSP